jgi:hypothetical protein
VIELFQVIAQRLADHRILGATLAFRILLAGMTGSFPCATTNQINSSAYKSHKKKKEYHTNKYSKK